MDWVKKDNVGWIDVLRIVAIFAVIYSHCCDNFIGEFNNNRACYLTGLFMESIGRPCVVLLVMVSGWLLLPIRRPGSLTSYYGKRIGRIAVPLVFWSIALPLMFYVYVNVLGGADSRNPLIDATMFSWSATCTKLYTFLFNFSFDATPLWYLYMLIGIYLAQPIVDAWLRQASKRDVEVVLLLWGASLLLPYLRVVFPLLGADGEVGFAKLWGECDWNFQGALYYMSGFMGYMLLAYYLKTYPLNWTWGKTLAVAIPVYLAGYAVTSFGYDYTNTLAAGQYRYLEIPWTMCGINVAMQAFGVFIVFMKLRVKSRPWLSRVAAMMFGVYLCHFPFAQLTYDWFDLPWPYALRIVATAVTTFAISFVLTSVLYAWRPTRRLVA